MRYASQAQRLGPSGGRHVVASRSLVESRDCTADEPKPRAISEIASTISWTVMRSSTSVYVVNGFRLNVEAMQTSYDGDDHLSASVSGAEIAERFGGLSQRVCSVDDWPDVASVDALLEKAEVFLGRATRRGAPSGG
jgi:hypothetical protein